MQIQDADVAQALQAVCRCRFVFCEDTNRSLPSFELGGEKKTKGAALTFVRRDIHLHDDSSTDTVLSDCISILCRASVLMFSLVIYAPASHYVKRHSLVHMH